MKGRIRCTHLTNFSERDAPLAFDGVVGELGPRRTWTSAIMRWDSARRALREVAERPAAQILRRGNINKIVSGEILIWKVLTRARQAWPAAGRRLHARLLARRAATGASRGHRRRSAGRPNAAAGSALSCEVRDCENDARRCPRRASRRSYECRGSFSRPWWWSGATRAAVVGDVGVGVARLSRRRRRQGVVALSVGIWDWVAEVCAPKIALIWSPALLG